MLKKIILSLIIGTLCSVVFSVSENVTVLDESRIDEPIPTLISNQSDYYSEKLCKSNEQYQRCGDECEETCSYDRSSDKRPKSCNEQRKCKRGCFCKSGLVRHEGECIAKRKCPKKEDKCRDTAKIHCISPKREDCMKSCQNPKFKKESWMKCNPKKQRKCYTHCECPKGKTYDANLNKCVKECIPSCPKDRRIYCKSSDIEDCVKTCGNKNLEIEKKYKCKSPKDPDCKVYCDCGPDRYLNPITKMCVNCNEATTGCTDEGKALVTCSKPDPNDCKLTCNRPSLPAKLLCDKIKIPGLCHQHCLCAGEFVDNNGQCISYADECPNAQLCMTKIACLQRGTDPVCSNFCGELTIDQLTGQCTLGTAGCVEDYVCPLGYFKYQYRADPDLTKNIICISADRCDKPDPKVPDICVSKDQRTTLMGCEGTEKDCQRTCKSKLTKTSCCMIDEKNPNCKPVCVCPDNKIWDETSKQCVEDQSQCSTKCKQSLLSSLE